MAEITWFWWLNCFDTCLLRFFLVTTTSTALSMASVHPFHAWFGRSQMKGRCCAYGLITSASREVEDLEVWWCIPHLCSSLHVVISYGLGRHFLSSLPKFPHLLEDLVDNVVLRVPRSPPRQAPPRWGPYLEVGWSCHLLRSRVP